MAKLLGQALDNGQSINLLSALSLGNKCSIRSSLDIVDTPLSRKPRVIGSAPACPLKP